MITPEKIEEIKVVVGMIVDSLMARGNMPGRHYQPIMEQAFTDCVAGTLHTRNVDSWLDDFLDGK